ncbi:MAG: NAD(P)/FAD-dependent oxidoreductase [Acetobacteraceae bacterium]|nr:NAD(P)/FAD-dependent oxidoreductase [Acetobacteraceae bacterium]MBV8591849.1 NAD(P)/FAD-dependent oxidoreductase [Acetobacteraceae bacterium]
MAPNPQPAKGKPEIVVVGGGAAGIELVTKLGDRLGKRGQAQIALIEKSRTHLWKPLLHAVASGSMNPVSHELDYLAQASWHYFGYRYGEMIGLDRSNKAVHLAATHDDEGVEITPPRSVAYDMLVVAIGSIVNDFGTPGAAQYAIPLETADQAERFNQRLVNACIRAHVQAEPIRPGQLHVAIIGAGATGTELAADLHRTIREVVAYGLGRIDPAKDIKIILIEAADRIVPALPPRISERTLDLLQRLGVEVRAKSRVSEVRADGVVLATGEFIPSELVVWAAGVKAPEVLRNLDGLEVNRINQLVVLPTLQTTRDPDVFAIGDCAACPIRPDASATVPPRAQAAHQQATHLVKQIGRRLAGLPLEPYIYRDFGSLVTLGKYETVGNLMGFIGTKNVFIEGYIARMMYRWLYKMHETAIYGAWKTLLWTAARRLTRQAEPEVKLH